MALFDSFKNRPPPRPFYITGPRINFFCLLAAEANSHLTSVPRAFTPQPYSIDFFSGEIDLTLLTLRYHHRPVASTQLFGIVVLVVPLSPLAPSRSRPFVFFPSKNRSFEIVWASSSRRDDLPSFSFSNMHASHNPCFPRLLIIFLTHDDSLHLCAHSPVGRPIFWPSAPSLAVAFRPETALDMSASSRGVRSGLRFVFTHCSSGRDSLFYGKPKWLSP